MGFLPGINKIDGDLRTDSATIQINTHKVRWHLDGQLEELVAGCDRLEI